VRATRETCLMTQPCTSIVITRPPNIYPAVPLRRRRLLLRHPRRRRLRPQRSPQRRRLKRRPPRSPRPSARLVAPGCVAFQFSHGQSLPFRRCVCWSKCADGAEKSWCPRRSSRVAARRERVALWAQPPAPRPLFGEGTRRSFKRGRRGRDGRSPVAARVEQLATLGPIALAFPGVYRE
jgi:hypothetical protein